MAHLIGLPKLPIGQFCFTSSKPNSTVGAQFEAKIKTKNERPIQEPFGLIPWS